MGSGNNNNNGRLEPISFCWHSKEELVLELFAGLSRSGFFNWLWVEDVWAVECHLEVLFFFKLFLIFIFSEKVKHKFIESSF